MGLSVKIPLFNKDVNVAILYGRIRSVLDTTNNYYMLISVKDAGKVNSIQHIEALSFNNSKAKFIDFTLNFRASISACSKIQPNAINLQ